MGMSNLEDWQNAISGGMDNARKGNTAEAIALLQSGISLIQDDCRFEREVAEATNYLASVYVDDGDFLTAEREMEKAVEKCPPTAVGLLADIKLGLAIIRLKCGNPAMAHEAAVESEVLYSRIDHTYGVLRCKSILDAIAESQPIIEE